MRSFAAILIVLPALCFAGTSGMGTGESAGYSRAGGSSSTSTSYPIYNVKTYGAKCDGTTDDSAAFQATVDALPSTGGGVYVPTSAGCKMLHPVFITKSHVRIFGDGDGSIINGGGNARPIFVFYPSAWPNVPTFPGIISNQAAIDFPNNNQYLPLDDALRAQDPQINGLTEFGVGMWVHPYGTGRTGPNYFIHSGGHASAGSSYDESFYIKEDGSGGVTCHVTTSNGAFTAAGGGALPMDTDSPVELSYDGANLRCFVNGVSGAAVAATGTMVQKAWEQADIGPEFLEYGYEHLNGGGPNARVGNATIFSIPPHTSNYSVPYQFGSNNAILQILNGDATLIDRICVPAQQNPVMIYQYSNINATLGGDEVDHLMFESPGRPIVMYSVINASVHDIYLDQPIQDGIIYGFLSYGSSIHGIRGIGNVRTFINVTNSGLTHIWDFYLTGARVAAIYSGGAGTTSIRAGYMVPTSSGTLYDIWVNAYGATEGTVHIDDVSMSTESGGATANLALESLAGAYIDASTFEGIQAGGTAFIRLDTTDNQSAGTPYQGGFPVTISNSKFVASNNTDVSRVFDFVGTWTKSNVQLLNSILDVGNLTVIANKTALVNFSPHSGQCTVSGAATTCDFTFAQSEFDTSYYVIATPTASTGTPAAGSNRVLSIAKTTSKATITVEAAPGVGNSVTFDTQIVPVR